MYRHLREGGLLSADRLRAIAAEDVSTLSGTGRGEVHRRAVRLRDLLEDVGQGHDVPETVARILDPDRWIEGEGTHVELARQDIERLRTEANRILDEAEEPLPLVDLVARVRNRIASREPLGLDAAPDIKIVTLWGAKGLTADFVYIIGLCDEALPGPYDPNSSGLDEGEHLLEQLRLLYVSLTGAKRVLVISRPSKIRRGEVPALGLSRSSDGNPWWQYLHRCRFFDDLSRAALPGSVDGELWEGIREE